MQVSGRAKSLGPLKDRFAGNTRRSIRGIDADGDVVVLRWNGETELVDGQTYCKRYAFLFTMHDGLAVRVEEFCGLPTYEAAKVGAATPHWEAQV